MILLRKILLQKLNNYLREQNREIGLKEEVSLYNYSRLKYDEFLELIRYCRYLIDMDVPGDNSDYLNKKLLEYQNDFVSYLIRATSVEQVDIYYQMYNQIILSLFYNDNKKVNDSEE